MSTADLTATLLIGVLLPVSFVRPAQLQDIAAEEHAKRRVEYLYTCFAFAAMGYVYFTATALIHPGRLPTQTANALAGGGLILLAIALTNHIPPLLTRTANWKKAALISTSAVGLGVTMGGFLAVDELFIRVRNTYLAVGTWAALALLIYSSAVWHSGLSPAARQMLDHRRQRPHDAKPSVAGAPGPRRGCSTRDPMTEVKQAASTNQDQEVVPMSRGLDGRSRDENGRIRAKRSDTTAGTLAATYPEFRELPPETTLGDLKERLGTESLDQTRRALRGEKP